MIEEERSHRLRLSGHKLQVARQAFEFRGLRLEVNHEVLSVE